MIHFLMWLNVRKAFNMDDYGKFESEFEVTIHIIKQKLSSRSMVFFHLWQKEMLLIHVVFSQIC